MRLSPYRLVDIPGRSWIHEPDVLVRRNVDPVRPLPPDLGYSRRMRRLASVVALLLMLPFGAAAAPAAKAPMASANPMKLQRTAKGVSVKLAARSTTDELQGHMVGDILDIFGVGKHGRHTLAESRAGKPATSDLDKAVNSDGNGMLLTVRSLSVNGLHNKNAKPTRVMALDSGKILARNGGSWPGSAAALAKLLKDHPDAILVDVELVPPAAARITGIPKGRKVTVLTGAEALFGNPPKKPPGSQALLINASALKAATAAAAGKRAND